MYLRFSLRIVGKVNCDFAQINSEKNVINFSSCYPLTISVLIDLIENTRYLLDVKEAFNCFVAQGASSVVGDRHRALPKKEYLQMFKHTSVSRSDLMFFTDIPGEELELQCYIHKTSQMGPIVRNQNLAPIIKTRF